MMEPVGRRYCYCGFPAARITAWTDANPGRRFDGCSRKPRGGCDFFRWVDPPMCARSRQVIPGLLRKQSLLETQVDRGQARVKKLWFCLILSWLVFVFSWMNDKSNGP